MVSRPMIVKPEKIVHSIVTEMVAQDPKAVVSTLGSILTWKRDPIPKSARDKVSVLLHDTAESRQDTFSVEQLFFGAVRGDTETRSIAQYELRQLERRAPVGPVKETAKRLLKTLRGDNFDMEEEAERIWKERITYTKPQLREQLMSLLAND